MRRCITESGTTHGRLAFPSDHPLNGQGLPLWSPEVRQRLQEYDVLLVVGMDLLRQYVYHEPSRAIPEHIRLVHIDEDPWQLGKNYPVEVGVIGDTKTGTGGTSATLLPDGTCRLRAADAARQRATDTPTSMPRPANCFAQQIAQRARHAADDAAGLMGALAECLAAGRGGDRRGRHDDQHDLRAAGRAEEHDRLFRPSRLGVGLGTGVADRRKLAWPERPVLALLGEGAAMYGIQGLWSAARYHIPVTFVICNNAQYQILKIGARGIQLPRALAGQYEGLDIGEPEIDFVCLARFTRRRSPSHHRTRRTGRRASANRCAATSWSLFDVPIARETPKRLNYG